MKKTNHQAANAPIDLAMKQNAHTHFSAGRYKEASALFKELLKQSDDVEYRKCLAECYLQRAKSMAAKSMLKEACILWENYADYAEAPLQAQDAYLLWLLAAKNNSKAFAIIEGFDARQLEEDYAELATWLGFLLVCGLTEMLPHLPQDSMLFRHWELINEALDAYRKDETERCNQILNTLPFRSAFRDLRTLLKSQRLDTASLPQAQTALTKIPEHSPYRQAANALLAYLQSGMDFVNSMAALDPNQRRAIAHAKGLSSKHIELLETVIKQQDPLDAKSRFNIALRYRETLGINAARAYCLSALTDDHRRNKDYLKHFAENDDFEANRVQALLCEQFENHFDAGFFWEQCIEILKDKQPENNRKIALILRHMAGFSPPAETADLLSESLQYDPDDRQSYLTLLKIYEQDQPNARKYTQWLEQGLKHFPADTDLLVRAAKSAADRKAFKKAAAYAKALLKTDPVNTLAKQLLFANHMAHARRLLKTEKLHLVEKELEAAEQLSIDKNLRNQSELLRGFLIWQTDDKKQDLQQIIDTLGKLNNDPVNMQFQAQMEAELLELPTAPLTKALPAAKDYLLSDRELHRLIEAIEYYDQQLDDNGLLIKALDSIKAPLKKSIQWLLEYEALLLSWCRILQRIGHFELLKQCAKLGNTRWRKPIWLYYLTLADCKGDASRLDFMVLYRLQNALEEAHAEQDAKTAFLIGRLIDQSRAQMNPFEFVDDAEAFEPALPEQDPLDDLFGHLPEAILIKISKRLERMTQKTDPDRFTADYIRQYAKTIDPQRLATLFMNPDFFSSVLFLAAAEDLKIDIRVSFEDIVRRFDDDTPQYSLPFF